ncbi:MAG: hypothetical protein U1E98_02730 [Moraxella osloensis]
MPWLATTIWENFGIQTHIIDDTGHFFHGKLGELKQLLEALSSK